MSRFVTYGTFHALSAAALSSATAARGFGRLVRYGRLVGDAGAVRLQDRRDHVGLELAVTGTIQVPAEAVDALLSLVLRIARRLRDNRELERGWHGDRESRTTPCPNR